MVRKSWTPPGKSTGGVPILKNKTGNRERIMTKARLHSAVS